MRSIYMNDERPKLNIKIFSLPESEPILFCKSQTFFVTSKNKTSPHNSKIIFYRTAIFCWLQMPVRIEPKRYYWYQIFKPKTPVLIGVKVETYGVRLMLLSQSKYTVSNQKKLISLYPQYLVIVDSSWVRFWIRKIRLQIWVFTLPTVYTVYHLKVELEIPQF